MIRFSSDTKVDDEQSAAAALSNVGLRVDLNSDDIVGVHALADGAVIRYATLDGHVDFDDLVDSYFEEVELCDETRFRPPSVQRIAAGFRCFHCDESLDAPRHALTADQRTTLETVVERMRDLAGRIDELDDIGALSDTISDLETTLHEVESNTCTFEGNDQDRFEQLNDGRLRFLQCGDAHGPGTWEADEVDIDDAEDQANSYALIPAYVPAERRDSYLDGALAEITDAANGNVWTIHQVRLDTCGNLTEHETCSIIGDRATNQATFDELFGKLPAA